VRRWLVGAPARVVLAGLRTVPLPVLRPLLRGVVGRPCHLLHGARARRSLRLALGDTLDERTRADLARRSCVALGDTLAEFLAATRDSARVLATVDDRDAMVHVERLKRDFPGGFIGLTGHVGNWELLAHWAGKVLGRPPLVIAKRLPNPHLNETVVRLRARLDLETLYQDESPARAIRALRDGRMVGVVPDQDVKSLSGMFLEFFGRPAFTPVGPARLAVAAEVPIVCAVFLRTPTGFRVHVCDPIVPDPSRPRGEEMERLTRAWSKQVEDVIRAQPEQWPWLHDRWKTTPEKLAARGRRGLLSA
jgi:KDO2-lipid IV(A) lauroyltransferase